MQGKELESVSEKIELKQSTKTNTLKITWNEKETERN